jgi:predicted MFS family arabinose efflux permease
MVGVFLRQIETSSACGIHRTMAKKSITMSPLSPGSLTSLISLTLGAFAIGTEGFVIAGLLSALAQQRAGPRLMPSAMTAVSRAARSRPAATPVMKHFEKAS